jgi:hypothetical protein
MFELSRAMWAELVAPDVPESFRVRYSHFVLLVDELRLIAELAAEDGGRWGPHLKAIQAELTSALQVADKLVPLESSLKFSVEQLTKEASAWRCLHLSESLLDDKYRLGVEALNTLRSLSSIQEKRKLNGLLGIVCTEILAQGVPDSHIAAIAAKPTTMEALLTSLSDAISPSESDFICHIKLSGSRENLQAIFTDERIRSSVEIHSHELTIEQRAGSAFDAARRALAEVERRCNLFTFYRYDQPLRPKHTVRVAKTDDDHETVEVNVDHIESSPLLLRTNARRLTSNAFAAMRAHDLGDRFWSALEQYTVAQQAFDVRPRLIGVWSALETLTGGQRGFGSVYDRVAAVVVPAVVSKRVERIARYFAIRAHEGTVLSRMSKQDRAEFARSNLKSFDVGEVLTALCGPEKNVRILLLLKYSDDLQRFRLFNAWQELHDPKVLAERLERSYEGVAQHLRRIYRARNLIIHNSTSYRNLDVLLRHLEEYFSITLSRILREHVVKPRIGLDALLATFDGRLKFLLAALERGYPLRVDDFIPSAAGTTAQEHTTLFRP